MNITHEECCRIVGPEIGEALKKASIAIYERARDYAAERGVIICDTKFEFGMYEGSLIVIDEMLTPDSSRFWDASLYRKGQGQPSYDKQYVRDYLETLDWNKEYPGPELPAEVRQVASEKYRECYRLLTGKEL